MPIREAQDWFAVLARRSGRGPDAHRSREREFLIARQIFKEIRERLGFLVDVGLDYLTLDRVGQHALRRRGAANPAGDADRLQLMGVLYILDEPSIGLHQRDNARLIRTLGDCATSATP